MNKEIPKILAQNDVLTIAITADELKWITENRPDHAYVVHDKSQFLKDFAGQLENYHTTNESGMTKLQELIDEITDDTYEWSESITNKNDE